MGNEKAQEKLKALVVKKENAADILGGAYDFDEQKSLARQDWKEAQAHAEAAVYKTIQLGKRLCVMKEVEGHGKMTDVRQFVGIEASRATEAMRLYREIGETPTPALVEAGPSKLLEIFRLPQDVKEEALETGMLDGDPIAQKSVRELREYTKKLLKKNEKLEAQNEKGKEQYAQLSRESTELKNGRSNIDDEEAINEILKNREQFGAIKFSLTTLPFHNLNDETLTKVKAFIEEMRASLTLCERTIAELNEGYSLVNPFVSQMEVDQAEETEAAMKKHFKFTGK